MSGRVLALGLLGLLIAVLAGVTIYVANTDWQSRIEQAAEQATGRDASLGSLQVEWTWPPVIVAENLRLANAEWGSRPDMIRIGRLVLEPAIWESLWGALTYRRLYLFDAAILLERNHDGTGNWEFGDGGSGGSVLVPKTRADFPTLIDFLAERSEVIYRKPVTGVDIRIGFDRLAVGAADADQPVQIAAAGRYDGSEVALAGTTGSYGVLRSPGEPFPARFTLRHQQSELTFDGTLIRPLDFDGVRGALAVAGADAAELAGFFGVQAGGWPSYRIEGILDHHQRKWDLSQARGELAGSHFDGWLSLTEGDGSDAADALGLQLDFGPLDVAALIPEGTGSGLPEPPPGEIIPPLSLALPPPDRLVLTARLNAAELRYRDLSLGGFAAELQADTERYALPRFDLDVAGGHVGGSAELTTRDGTPHLALHIDLAGLDVGRAAAMVGSATDAITGAVGGRIDLAGSGGTLQDVAAVMNGRLALGMDHGSIRRSLVAKAELKLGALLFPDDQARHSRIVCLIADLPVRQGTGEVNKMFLETPQATLRGTGTVAFGPETVDLTVTAEAKEPGLFDLDAPIAVTGRLGDISAAPKAGPLAAQAGAAAALGVLATPLAALLPLIETGLGKDSPCVARLRQEPAE